MERGGASGLVEPGGNKESRKEAWSWIKMAGADGVVDRAGSWSWLQVQERLRAGRAQAQARAQVQVQKRRAQATDRPARRVSARNPSRARRARRAFAAR